MYKFVIDALITYDHHSSLTTDGEKLSVRRETDGVDSAIRPCNMANIFPIDFLSVEFARGGGCHGE